MALDALAKLTRQYATRPDFKELIHTLLLTLSGQFASPSAFAHFKAQSVDADERLFVATGKFTTNRMLQSLTFSDDCRRYFLQNMSPTVVAGATTEDDCDTHHRIIQDAGVELICPVLHEDALLGVIGLGPRAIRKPYTPEDIELIDTLIRTISPLIASSYHHYEIDRLTARHIDILNNVKQAIFLFDQDFNLKSLNKVGRDLLVNTTGQTDLEPVFENIHISDAFPPERFPGWSSIFLKTAIESPGIMVERLFRIDSGEEQLFEAYITPIADESSITNDTLVAVEDVTERVRAEDALHMTQFSVENSADAAFWIDEDANLIYVNKASCKNLGYTREELLNMTVHDIDPNFPKDIWGKHWEECAKTGSMTVESFHRTKDSRVFPVEISINYYKFHDKGFLSAYARDMTQRIEAEEALRESLQKSADIVAAMPAGLFIYQYEHEDRLILVESNPEATRLTGVSSHESEGKEFEETWKDSQAGPTKKLFLQALRTGVTYEGERDTCSGGTTDHVYRVRAFKMSKQRLGVAFEDITKERMAEQEKRKLQDQLARAQKMESLAILAGGVAHDLNNMLGPLVGYPELILLKLPEDSPIRRQVKRIGKAAEEAANVVQDLLTLARRGRYEMGPINLNEIVLSYLDSPGFEKLGEKRPEIELIQNLDESLTDITGSRPHLMKVIMNLCINSYDATPEAGSVTVSTGIKNLKQLSNGHDEITPGDYAFVSVKDTGKGIAAEDLPRIFEPYFSKKKMGTSGSGLGLSVVYGIVKDHSGYYDIITEPGKGADFQLYFPASETIITRRAKRRKQAGGSETILIVDDVEDQRAMAGELLSSLGYSVQLAASGQEAIKLAGGASFDLVVLDMILLDGMDGFDTYQALLEIRSDQKAIIISGYSATDRVENAQCLGAGEYIKKPFTLETIGQAVRSELDRKPTKS